MSEFISERVRQCVITQHVIDGSSQCVTQATSRLTLPLCGKTRSLEWGRSSDEAALPTQRVQQKTAGSSVKKRDIIWQGAALANQTCANTHSWWIYTIDVAVIVTIGQIILAETFQSWTLLWQSRINCCEVLCCLLSLLQFLVQSCFFLVQASAYWVSQSVVCHRTGEVCLLYMCLCADVRGSLSAIFLPAGWSHFKKIFKSLIMKRWCSVTSCLYFMFCFIAKSCCFCIYHQNFKKVWKR